jgi:hypothetical protein
VRRATPPYRGLVTHDHVLLLADNDGEEPVLESTPAREERAGEWLLLATPGLAQGCAAGDVVRVEAEGWCYGNVYDDNDAPLDWWIHDRT